jgi:peptidoglycan/LPS O-acetylase OafA/YrhL
VHFLVLKQLSLGIDQGGWSKLAYFGVIASVGLAVTVVLASITFRWIEQPFQDMAGRIVRRRENPAARAGASSPAQSSSPPG